MTQSLPFDRARTETTVALYHGDCLEMMPKLAPNSIKMVFADLPYGITQKKWDTRIDINKFWISSAQIAGQKCAFILTATGIFAAEIILSNRSKFRYDLIWHKKRSTGFLNANRMPLRSHEQILIFYNKMPCYNPQKTAGLPWSRPLGRSANHKYGGKVQDNLPLKSDGMRHPTSLLSVPSGTANSLHPTQKPVALLEWLIKTYTNPGDTVLDPTAGSGTTGVAALRTGRNAILIEKDATYFEVMRKRIAAEQATLGFEVTV